MTSWNAWFARTQSPMIERRSSPGSRERSSCEMRREPLLALVELLELLGRELRRGHLGREPLQLGADEERLLQLVARERANADAAVRDERDEPERGQPAQRLAHRRPRHVELLRELLLPEDGARARAPRRRSPPRSRARCRLPWCCRASLQMSVRGQREELDQLGGERELGEQLPSPRRRPRPRRSRGGRRASSNRPARTHCHTCEREISAVAASSIRLSIAAAPTPCSHASR